ncbi:hypothetical protein NUU61_004227 [Penicillium alfredii]|uniref:3-hydroxyacyl-CoA dehydrogenase NAD binding domain-containing protein n=1 Tax=Penicillium alfredii TaxID=1506179 RepID=A0A9W9FL40_9EURO|nr:uncharacterized protein NUU61_004227 [Penicillium alfredii]KAJ5102005.1 hypothetical protein NUU61_004227 [Penicillium alfredii]
MVSRTDRPVAIVGAGVLGRRIACVFVAAGYNVHIQDSLSESRQAAIDYIDEHKQQFASRLRNRNGNDNAPEATRQPVYGNCKAFVEIGPATSDAWLAIEAVPKPDGKPGIFAELDAKSPRDCILASSSSSFKSVLRAGKVSAARQKRCLNIYFMWPPAIRTVWLMEDCEIGTDSEIFPQLESILTECGMTLTTEVQDSTGSVLDRLWTVAEFLYKNGPGPNKPKSQPGYDFVTWVEENYSEPPSHNDEAGSEDTDTDTNPATPRLKDMYLLDLGFGGSTQDLPPTSEGRILRLNQTTQALTPVVVSQNLPDGIDVSPSTQRIYWTNMGKSVAFCDGSVWSANLDGSDIQCLVPTGKVHTPKQLAVHEPRRQLYFSDREGGGVHRCDFDGGNHEVLVQRDRLPHWADQMTQWCVGIAIDVLHDKMYWTQKGPSKGNRGRIFCAGLDIPAGETAATRSDIRLLFDGLPEPIDAVVDGEDEILYWTDRGEHPAGCALYRAYVGEESLEKSVLARHFHEPIGLKLDKENNLIYVVDLGGSIYSVTLNKGVKTLVLRNDGCYTGITLV